MIGRQTLRQLPLEPDAFAVVMATGILSIAARDHSYTYLDLSLAAAAVIAFVFLCVRCLLQIIADPRSLTKRAREPDVALRMFTFVAACAVLEARFHTHQFVMWSLAGAVGASWLILALLSLDDVYSCPRAQLRERSHGAWLLGSVATAGLAITAADLAVNTRWKGWILLSIAAWILAIASYLITAVFIVRATSRPIAAHSIAPDAWILMGALAICTLAGVHARGVLASREMLPRMDDMMRLTILVLWVAASVWIPILLGVQIWQFLHHRNESVHFSGVWWAAVFPLGMYSTATQATALQLHLETLTDISIVMFWVAFGVWGLVATGWLHSLIRTSAHPSPSA